MWFRAGSFIILENFLQWICDFHIFSVLLKTKCKCFVDSCCCSTCSQYFFAFWVQIKNLKNFYWTWCDFFAIKIKFKSWFIMFVAQISCQSSDRKRNPLVPYRSIAFISLYDSSRIIKELSMKQESRDCTKKKPSTIPPSIDLFKSRITQASPNNFNKLLKNPHEIESSPSDIHESLCA
jgi:hypothetical protein